MNISSSKLGPMVQKALTREGDKSSPLDHASNMTFVQAWVLKENGKVCVNQGGQFEPKRALVLVKTSGAQELCKLLGTAFQAGASEQSKFGTGCYQHAGSNPAYPRTAFGQARARAAHCGKAGPWLGRECLEPKCARRQGECSRPPAQRSLTTMDWAFRPIPQTTAEQTGLTAQMSMPGLKGV